MGLNSRKIFEESSGVYALITATLLAWVFLYHQALLSAIKIWYVSEIFSHGFFILPGAMYFIWRERTRLEGLSITPNYYVLFLIVPALVLGVVGEVGGVQVFSHISAFSVLPLTIWFFVGNAVARVIWFPLCFILFSIPVGEELVPYLQKITADMAITLLSWTSIPSYNTGLYIEIPQGKFVVAEACSGIRFFVGSLVFGAVYSHMSYRSFARKSVFMLLALVVPVVANALRVFGIVLVGYFIDMKYATGADHLIYGWVFFSIVLFLLVMIGETFREKKINNPMSGSDGAKNATTVRSIPCVPGVVLLILFGFTVFWQHQVALDGDVVESSLDSSVLERLQLVGGAQKKSWSPIFKGESDYYQGYFLKQEDTENVGVVLAWYSQNREGAELVASSNALYDKEAWSELGSRVLNAMVAELPAKVKLINIISVRGEKRLVLYWYQLRGRILTNHIQAKLYQTLDVLLGGEGAGALVAVSSAYGEGDEELIRNKLLEIVELKSTDLVKMLPFN